MRRSTCSTCLTKKSCQNVLGWRMVLGWFCCCIVSLLLFKFPYSSQICLGEATGIQGLTLQWSCIATCFRHITSSCGACGVCEVLKLIEIKGKKKKEEISLLPCWSLLVHQTRGGAYLSYSRVAMLCSCSGLWYC